MARKIGGVILAGGQSRRMGKAKSDVLLHGKPLLAHVIENISLQVDKLAISFGNNCLSKTPDSIHHLDDGIFPGEGPLAGMLAGLQWGQANGFDLLLFAPVDTPFLPCNLVNRLRGINAAIAVAASGTQIHPTVSLWQTEMTSVLETHMNATAKRSILDFLQTQGFAECDFPFNDQSLDPFFNINTPDDLKKAHAYAN